MEKPIVLVIMDGDWADGGGESGEAHDDILSPPLSFYRKMAL